jgi:hypothetical protein
MRGRFGHVIAVLLRHVHGCRGCPFIPMKAGSRQLAAPCHCHLLKPLGHGSMPVPLRHALRQRGLCVYCPRQPHGLAKEARPPAAAPAPVASYLSPRSRLLGRCTAAAACLEAHGQLGHEGLTAADDLVLVGLQRLPAKALDVREIGVGDLAWRRARRGGEARRAAAGVAPTLKARRAVRQCAKQPGPAPSKRPPYGPQTTPATEQPSLQTPYDPPDTNLGAHARHCFDRRKAAEGHVNI